MTKTRCQSAGWNGSWVDHGVAVVQDDGRCHGVASTLMQTDATMLVAMKEGCGCDSVHAIFPADHRPFGMQNGMNQRKKPRHHRTMPPTKRSNSHHNHDVEHNQMNSSRQPPFCLQPCPFCSVSPLQHHFRH
mmetsp:Transcript_19549/g.54320  ORF Transcript_19549/g.54320 Transcript_19549/m.54320 type:complete len:132 (-) Transcript_19549:16-411(-)